MDEGNARDHGMKTVAIVQARMGSTRLPGKVLLDLGGDTVLARVLSRVRRCRMVNQVLVATSVDAADDVIEEECRRLVTTVFRGSQSDVLDRYYRAAEESKAEVIVRVTADCPLLDPEICDRTIRAFVEARPDYASNTLERSYPRGLDTEVIARSALVRAWCEAKEPFQREHVTPYIHQHPEQFRLVSVRGERDHSRYRWTLDTPEDLEFLRRVYSSLGDSEGISFHDVLAFLGRNPALALIDRHIERKALRSS